MQCFVLSIWLQKLLSSNDRWGVDYIFMQSGMRGNKCHAMGVQVAIATVVMTMCTYMPYKAMLCCVLSGDDT